MSDQPTHACLALPILQYEHPEAAFRHQQLSLGRYVPADGSSPLHLAALKGHSGVVQFLLSKQAWADAQDAQDNTALHLAAR